MGEGEKLRRLVVVLFCLLALVGCGTSNSDFVGAPGASTGLSLQVQADQTGLARGALGRFSSQTAGLQVSLYDNDLDLIETQEGNPRETFTFTGLFPGQYLVRTVGLDAGGNILGYFDRVVELTGSGLTAVIPGLRPAQNPPAVAFPSSEAQPFFLFEELPERVRPGQSFNVALQLYSPDGLPLEQVLDQVSLTASGLTLTQAPPIQQTNSTGSVTFANLAFVEGIEGLARLQVEAPQVSDGFSDQIRVVIALPDPNTDPDEVLSMSFDVVPNDGVEGEELDTVVVKVVNSQGEPPESDVDVSISLNNPGGAFLSGTLAQPTVGGLAAFEDLTIDQPGQFTLRAAILESPDDPPLNVPPVNSPIITIDEAPIPKLQFRAVPNEVLQNLPITPVVVDLFDEDGIPFDEEVEVTISLSPASQGNGSLSGTLIADSSVNGNVSFNSLSITEPGDYVLRAVSDGFRSAESGTITITQPTLPFQTIKLVTKTTDGQGLNDQTLLNSISGNGRVVGFTSEATNVVPNDTNGVRDGFVFDFDTGENERVSVSSAGSEGDFDSVDVQLSDDGNKAAFVSGATNLDLLTTNNVSNIFLRDRQAGSTQVISQANGETARFQCSTPRISGDGSTIAFITLSTINFFPGVASTGFTQLVTASAGQLDLITVNGDGEMGRQNMIPSEVAISGTGGVLAFIGADNLLEPAQQTNDRFMVFDGGLERALPMGTGSDPALSGDGQLLAYQAQTQGSSVSQIFVLNRGNDTTQLISQTSGGQGGNRSSFDTDISRDGRYVAFVSAATDLVSGDTNNANDIFVADRTTGELRIVSLDFRGNQRTFSARSPRISADGRFIAFQGLGNYVPNDPGGFDIYVVENPFTFQTP